MRSTRKRRAQASSAGAPFVSRLLLVSGVFLLLTGCAGYRLGPVNGMTARDKSIQVNPFSNQTQEPRLTDEVTFQLRKELERNGTYQLATSRDAGDVVVSGVITRYVREALSFQSNNLTVQDYRVSLTAHVTASDRASGKVLLNQDVTGFTLVRVGNDMVSAERQGLPLLASDLAKRVTALLSEGTW
jgi:hypothetical protein